ncbi:MAG: hypothetical protein NTV32_04135 [Gammaproteobacteria bacterium]|nr:hypothetical protein [Gammaproteobacteria bacterium]
MSFSGEERGRDTIKEMQANIEFVRYSLAQGENSIAREQRPFHDQSKRKEMCAVLDAYKVLTKGTIGNPVHKTLAACSTSSDPAVQKKYESFKQTLEALNVPQLRADKDAGFNASLAHNASYYHEGNGSLKSEKERAKLDKTTTATTDDDQVRYTGKGERVLKKEKKRFDENLKKYREKWKNIKEVGAVVSLAQILIKLLHHLGSRKSDPIHTEWEKVKNELADPGSALGKSHSNLRIVLEKDKHTGETIVQFTDAKGNKVSAKSEEALRVTEEVNHRLSNAGMEVKTNTPQPPAVASDSNKIKAAGEPPAGTLTNTIGGASGVGELRIPGA